MKEYREIGSIFNFVTYTGKTIKLRVIEDKDPCLKCYFVNYLTTACINSLCNSHQRDDKKQVIFKLTDETNTL